MTRAIKVWNPDEGDEEEGVVLAELAPVWRARGDMTPDEAARWWPEYQSARWGDHYAEARVNVRDANGIIHRFNVTAEQTVTYHASPVREGDGA